MAPYSWGPTTQIQIPCSKPPTRHLLTFKTSSLLAPLVLYPHLNLKISNVGCFYVYVWLFSGTKHSLGNWRIILYISPTSEIMDAYGKLKSLQTIFLNFILVFWNLQVPFIGVQQLCDFCLFFVRNAIIVRGKSQNSCTQHISTHSPGGNFWGGGQWSPNKTNRSLYPIYWSHVPKILALTTQNFGPTQQSSLTIISNYHWHIPPLPECQLSLVVVAQRSQSWSHRVASCEQGTVHSGKGNHPAAPLRWSHRQGSRNHSAKAFWR